MPLISPSLRLLCLLYSAMLLGGCSPYLSIRQNSRLSHEIIFPHNRRSDRKAPPLKDTILYLDAKLMYRPFFEGGSISDFADSARIEALRLDKVKPMRLTIPPEWEGLCKYYQGDIEIPIEHRENFTISAHPLENLAFYSPLIPTRKRNIYAMQVFFNALVVDDDIITMRLWYLSIRYFTIKRGKVISEQEPYYEFISAY